MQGGVSVCVCEREREAEKVRARACKRDTCVSERVSELERVCVCGRGRERGPAREIESGDLCRGRRGEGRRAERESECEKGGIEVCVREREGKKEKEGDQSGEF